MPFGGAPGAFLGGVAQQRNISQSQALQGRGLDLQESAADFQRMQAARAQERQQFEDIQGILTNELQNIQTTFENVQGNINDPVLQAQIEGLTEQVGFSIQNFQRLGDTASARRLNTILESGLTSITSGPTAEAAATQAGELAGVQEATQAIATRDTLLEQDIPENVANAVAGLATETEANSALGTVLGNVFVVNDETRQIAQRLGVDISQFADNATIQIESTGNLREFRAEDRSPNIAPDGSITPVARSSVRQASVQLFGGIFDPVSGNITGLNPEDAGNALRVEAEAERLMVAMDGLIPPAEAVLIAQRNVAAREAGADTDAAPRPTGATVDDPIPFTANTTAEEGKFYRALLPGGEEGIIQWVNGEAIPQ